MMEEISESKRLYETEPETRVKRFVQMTLSTKFRDVLRESQGIQSDFKNAMQSKIKRQIRIAKNDATEEELEHLARHPEEAQ
mmetsp:Transcript_13506/g.13239  ORF Transcript_13506/g.13239 Transcript_13506/m.13239 type:complete len:82 (+) Transcript_13506:335-580(+)